MAIRVLIWNEGRHEKQNPQIAEIYPQGIHGAIASALRQASTLDVSTATLDDTLDHGLTQDRLNNTDVLIWWAHMHHKDIPDPIVDRLQQRVLAGMGLIVLHSGHFSKIFQRLMGTTCNLKWREAGEREILWITRPNHPIVAGLDDHFILPHEEMYGEFFDIPEPLETILISSFAGGEVFRSGLTFTRGAGKIFYFRPGHETYPTYHDPNVLKVITNATHWAAPASPPTPVSFGRRAIGWVDQPKNA